MSDWNRLFDEIYLRTYAQLADPETGPRMAEGVVRLAGLEPGADVLDCPCGYGRHSVALAALGMHAVGADRSPVLLGEAKRSAGGGEWPQWVQADYRELPFEDASFDCVANLFSSLGYWGEDGDRKALGEFRRVLRPGGKLVLETMHRDRLMWIYTPTSWEELPDGGLMIEKRKIDYERGLSVTTHEVVERDGTRKAVDYEMRVYTATEWVGMARDAGFEHVACFGDFDETPISRETRLVLLAS